MVDFFEISCKIRAVMAIAIFASTYTLFVQVVPEVA